MTHLPLVPTVVVAALVAAQPELHWEDPLGGIGSFKAGLVPTALGYASNAAPLSTRGAGHAAELVEWRTQCWLCYYGQCTHHTDGEEQDCTTPHNSVVVPRFSLRVQTLDWTYPCVEPRCPQDWIRLEQITSLATKYSVRASPCTRMGIPTPNRLARLPSKMVVWRCAVVEVAADMGLSMGISGGHFARGAFVGQ